MWHRVISKTWSFRSSSVTRQVIIKRTNIGGTCQNSNATFCVIFKQCEGLSFLSSIFYGFWFLTVFHQIFLLRLRKLHIFFWLLCSLNEFLLLPFQLPKLCQVKQKRSRFEKKGNYFQVYGKNGPKKSQKKKKTD